MRRRSRGAVLVLVLGAVAILAAVAVELAARANVDVMLAARSSREGAYRRLFDAGASVGWGMLVEPEVATYDGWGESWNREIAFSLAPGETATVRVADESGKINIARDGDRARLGRMVGRLFEYLRKYEAGDTRRWREVESRIWARLGLGTAEEGGERTKPESLLTLDGLREAGLGAEDLFGKRGLSRYLTCFGDGKINLNTAPRAVLYALDEEFDAAIVDRIAQYRGDPDGGEGVYKPFEEPKDLRLVEGMVEHAFTDGRSRVVRDLFLKVQSLVTVRSSAFSVRISARVGDRGRDAWVFFEPKRIDRAGDPPRRSLRRLAFEEILP